MLRLAETACKVASDADAVVVSRDDNWGAQGVKIMGLPMGRRHWCVAVDGLEYKLSSLVIASTELRKLGVHASPSRYSAEVLDAQCRAAGHAPPPRLVNLAPRVTILKVTDPAP